MSALAPDRLSRLTDVLARHVASGRVPSLAWVVSRRGEVHSGCAGTAGLDTIFRIASMTKPVTAVATLLLIEECTLRLEDPVDRWLPELADRQVLARMDGPIDETVPAHRPITVADLLTFRSGTGMDFSMFGRQTTIKALAELHLTAGAPAPAEPPEPDEFMRRLGTVPLDCQPGERWLYNTSAEILGVLVARASGLTFDAFLQERVFAPLGMTDTGFSVPPAALDRFGPCYATDFATGEQTVYDERDGQWASPPAFPSGGAGLVSTVGDYLVFAEMLRQGGEPLLSRASVAAMTADHLTPQQRDDAGTGWGFGVGVTARRDGLARSVGSYGWDGGLGSTWANDPTEDLTAILLTDRAWESPAPPPVVTDFWTCVYAALP